VRADIRDEAAELSAAVLGAGLSARLLGGLAVWLTFRSTS